MVEYIIPIAGLGLGSHHYTFEIDDAFFNSFEYFEINSGALNLVVDLVKESNLLDFKFRFNGYLELVCDRCLEKYNQAVKNDYRLIVQYSDKYEEVSDEIITVPSGENNIDLSQYIFEYINCKLEF